MRQSSPACGSPRQVDASIIQTLVRDGYIPVIATVAASPEGQSLNVNADIAAGEVRALAPSAQRSSSNPPEPPC